MTLTVSLLIGAAAFVFDLSLWRADQKELQQVADLAAFASVPDYTPGNGVGTINFLLAEQAELLDPSGALSLSASEVSFNGGSALMITAARTSDSYFARIFGAQTQALSARAGIGLAGSGGAYGACVQTLAETPNTGSWDGNRFGVKIHNNATMSLTGCDLHSNATYTPLETWQTQRQSVYLDNGQLYARNLSMSGTYNQSNGGGNVLDVDSMTESVSPMSNPLVDFAPVATGPARVSPQDRVHGGGNDVTIEPGIYSNGILASNNNSVHMEAGVYYITGGDFRSKNGTAITMDEGVSVIMLSDGMFEVTDGSGVRNWIAPSEGETAGIAFWRSDADNCETSWGANKTAVFAGGADFQFDGILYFGDCDLVISNNAQITTYDKATYIIANSIEMTGNAGLYIDVNEPYGLAESWGGEATVGLVY
ncbi:MAG: hypothetical protein MRY64_13605 [Hyphomonadaceae bacterium]|nr:hypothetical protein [Hyphomonadaceae bacterium]